MIGVLTGPQRTAPVMQAVLAQVKLKSDLFHTFMDILRRENDVLWKCIQQHYCKYIIEIHYDDNLLICIIIDMYIYKG